MTSMARLFSSGHRQPAAPSWAAAPDGTDMFIDALQEVPLFGPQQPTSTLGGLIYCLFLAGYAIMVALASWTFASMTRLLPALLSSGNAVLLIITAILQHHLLYQIKKERMQGFFILSQKLRPIVHIPFAVISYGTAMMMLITVWQPVVHIRGVSISTLLAIVTFAEIVWAGASVSLYIWCIHRHNSRDMQPDVIHSLYSALRPSNSRGELRYGEGGRLAEQQTALLQYQRENLHYLSEEILRLQECLNKYKRSENGSTPQVDVVHLLAAREQELRALSAERDQLHAELQLAQNLIEERESDVQQIRTVNDQFVLENDRLRAILREWSTQAAKMERALEEERLSNVDLHKQLAMLRNSNEEST